MEPKHLAYSIKKAAELSDLSHWTLRKAISVGKLKALRVGRKLLISPQELERFLNGGRR